MNNKPMKVLLVEDNPGDARLIQEVLKEEASHRFTLQLVDRVSSAKELLAQDDFDLVLLDLSLPDSQGLESVRMLNTFSPHLPIIVLTGLEDDALALEAVQTGAQDYLVKDQIDRQQLLRAIVYAVERKQLYSALQKSEARIRLVIEQNVDGMVVVDQQRVVRYLNPASETLLNGKYATVIGQPFGIPWDVDQFLELKIPQTHNGMVTLEVRTISIDWEDQPAYLVSLRDISARKRMEQNLLQMATHDHLTGLPNRLLLEDRLAGAIERARRGSKGNSNKWETAVMMLDLDDFKQVNDTFGHEQGDLLLCSVAFRLKHSVRKSDTVARLGGDEFILVLENMNGDDDHEMLANKILEQFTRPFQLEVGNVKISPSIGISIYSRDGEDSETLIRHADRAMYQAKLVKNTFKLYKPMGIKNG